MSTFEALPIRESEAPTRRLGTFVSAWAVPLAVAAMLTLLIWSVHRGSPRTLVSFHGLLHAAIVEQFLGPDKSFSQPENPFFAGHQVLYYWFFHWLAAQLVLLFGLNVFHAMEALILFGVAVMLVVGVGLGRRLFGSTLSGAMIGYLIIAGTNPLGILFALYKIARNGTGVLNDDPNYLWGVVHPLYSLIRYNDFGGVYGPLFNFFLNMTSRPLALAGALLTVLCLYRALNKRALSSWLWLSLAIAVTTAFSPIIGLAAGGALMTGLVSVWLLGRRSIGIRGSSVSFSTVRSCAVAVAAGALLAAPTYYHLLLEPGSSKGKFSLFTSAGLTNLITVIVSIFPLVILGLLGLRRAPKPRKEFLTVLLVASSTLLMLAVSFTLTAGNHSNFFHAAVVLLAVVAAGAILGRSPDQRSVDDSPRRAAVIGLIFLPTVLALLAAYWSRPPLAASLESIHIERIEPDLRLLYQWARNETDPRAVFIIDPRDRVAVCGNTAEFPAMTGRAVFTEHLKHYLAEPYADAKLRFDMSVRLVSGEEARDSDREYLEKLDRSVFIVANSQGDVALDQMMKLYGTPAFRRDRISVYKWRDDQSGSISNQGKNRE